MLTKIYLVRHGQTNWNVRGIFQGQRKVCINNTGKEQVKRLAKALEGVSFDVVYCSPALRAMQTARILVPKSKLLFHRDFREFDRPTLEGLTQKKLKKIIPDVEEQWNRDGIDWRPPGGGETLREYQARSISAFKEIVKSNAGKTILIVTHGGPLKAIVHWLHGGKPEDFLHVKNPENAECVVIMHSDKKTKITKAFKN